MTANEAFGRRGGGAAFVPSAWIGVGMLQVKIPGSRMGGLSFQGPGWVVFCKQLKLSVFFLKSEISVAWGLGAENFCKSKTR